ncbi:MAG: class I SAM-dependent methyltransferase [Myxococcaceae bacterium]
MSDPTSAVRTLLGPATRGFEVALWDGSVLPAAGDAPKGRLVFRSPAAAQVLAPPASEVRAAEAFTAGILDIEGDTLGVLEAAARWPGPPVSLKSVEAVAAGWWQRVHSALAPRLRGRRHTPARDRSAVQYHYDVSDAFYRLFLGPSLVYSCAFFSTGDESLEAAQEAKLELVCRKLDLGPTDRLLDVGCGWGGLLRHAVQRYGVGGLGITLSEHQLLEARARLAALPPHRMEVRAADYRQLGEEPPFDKVASIGMMEHVGSERLDAYFEAMFRATRPGGLFLNHAIAPTPTPRNTIPWLSRQDGGFIRRYIFPDSELIPVGRVTEAAERAGFEVRDLESLREHYAQTLAHWLHRLEHRFDEAVQLVGAERARAWRLYLASSSVAFRLAEITVFQLLLVHPGKDGRAPVPRTRERWYAGLRQ